MNARAKEIRLMQRAGRLLDTQLKQEFVNQGHHLTGALEHSLQGHVIAAGRVTVLTGTMAGYGKFVNEGVKAANIPYGDGKGGGHSRYIQGLITFWKLRGLSGKEAISAAFATAKKHKKEGMPTSGSYKHSKNGKRLRFVQVVGKVVNEGITDMIVHGLDDIVDSKFRETKSETI